MKIAGLAGHLPVDVEARTTAEILMHKHDRPAVAIQERM
jgi:hypothetical protein